MKDQLYMSMEISIKSWKLCFSRGTKKRRRSDIEPGDGEGFRALIASMKQKFGLEPDAGVLSCHEAGLQGFWIHRFLTQQGIESLVVDAASIEVNRRKRRVKTDRIDVEKLMNLLLRHASGETGTWAIVNVPDPDVEDDRRLHRERDRLIEERTDHNNRIISLIRLHGPYNLRVNTYLLDELETLNLPENAREEIVREFLRWTMVDEQITEVEQKMHRMLKEGATPSTEKGAKMMWLRGIGLIGAYTLAHEMFGWREFKNRKQVGSYVGVTGTPYDSGGSTRDQGISKAGNARVRTLMNQLAWRWVHCQKDSELTKWFNRKSASGTSRQRRVAITGLSRKLAIALWRWVDKGILPEGADLKPLV